MTWTTRRRSELGGGLAGIVAGAGPLVVLIHGVGLRAEAWAPQIDALAPRFRVLAVDMPGHGDSALGGAQTLDDHAARIAQALAAPAVLIGHSMGAMVAARLAATAPGRAVGLGCLNAVRRRSGAARAAVKARAAQLDGRAAADPEPTLDRWFAGAQTDARRACRAWLNAADPAGYRSAYRIFAAEDGPDDAALQALPCPALFMTGGDEPNALPAMSRAMAALTPRGRAVIVPGAAHMMPMTHAAAVSAELLRLCAEAHDVAP